MPKQRRLKGPMDSQRRPDSQQQQDPPLVILRPNPLAISELIEMVGRCLDRHALTTCLRVCRQWYQVLRRMLWEVIEKYLGKCNPPDHTKSKGPSLPLLSKHADLVRKLCLKIHTGAPNFPGQGPIYCPWLADLRVVTAKNQENGLINSLLEENLAPFIVEHRATLRRLVLCVNQSKALMEAILTCSRLEFLKIQVNRFQESMTLDGWIDWYELQGSRLQSLVFVGEKTYPTIDYTTKEVPLDTFLSKVSVSSLQSLVLGALGPHLVPFEFQTLLVVKSPELKRLVWSDLGVKGAITRLAEVFEKTRPQDLFCQQLESLSIDSHGSFDLPDFKRVMESMPALTDLEMFGSNITRDIPSYVATLTRLRKLSIRRCSWATPSAVQDIMCSLPNLEVFEADSLSEIVLQKDRRPWVCTGLRELTILPVVLSGPPSSDYATIATATLGRLCQLKGLEKLKFPPASIFMTQYAVRVSPLILRLENGLDKLKTLTRLRCLETPRGQWWTEDEVRWALKHWTQLKELEISMGPGARTLLGPRIMKRPIVDDAFN